MKNNKAKAEFASRLSQLIKTRGITQQQLADYLDIKSQTVSQYCRGCTTPDYNVLVSIASYFHVTIDWLLGVSEYQDFRTRDRKVSEFGLSSEAVHIMVMHIDDKEGINGLNLLLERNDFYAVCSLLADLRKSVDANPNGGPSITFKLDNGETVVYPDRNLLKRMIVCEEFETLVEAIAGINRRVMP